MRINKEKRQELWEQYQEIEMKIISLKSIVQNNVEISKEDIEANAWMTIDVIKYLEEVMVNVMRTLED